MEARNPYLSHYRPAFACSAILYPLRRRRVLRLPTPKGAQRDYRVPPCAQEWFRPAHSAGGVCVHESGSFRPSAHHGAFLAQASQHLWLVPGNNVYRAFTCVGRATHACPRFRLMLTDPRRTSRFVRPPEGGRALSAGFSRVVTSPLRRPSVQLVEKLALFTVMSVWSNAQSDVHVAQTSPG